jgi:hypothetical protein
MLILILESVILEANKKTYKDNSAMKTCVPLEHLKLLLEKLSNSCEKMITNRNNVKSTKFFSSI